MNNIVLNPNGDNPKTVNPAEIEIADLRHLAMFLQKNETEITKRIGHNHLHGQPLSEAVLETWYTAIRLKAVLIALPEPTTQADDRELDLENVLDMEGIDPKIFEDHPELKKAVLDDFPGLDYSYYNEEIAGLLRSKAEDLGLSEYGL